MENYETIIGVIGTVVAIVSYLIYVSSDREQTIKKLSAVLLLILLPVAYLVYPEGIMSIPLTSLTLGDIGRLFISVILVLCFIVGELYLITDILDY